VIISGLSPKKIIGFYKNLFNIRSVENKIISEYPKGQMRCPVHLSIGQEGLATAVAYAVKKEDYFISNHRGHAHYLAKNCSVLKMFSELLGKKNGCSSGNGGSMHLTDDTKKFIGTTAIVSSSIPVGVGYAEALKIKKKKIKSNNFFR
jgi:TPP-dependent pyruvate/acetoin dehydrogenase alpha subunit